MSIPSMYVLPDLFRIFFPTRGHIYADFKVPQQFFSAMLSILFLVWADRLWGKGETSLHLVTAICFITIRRYAFLSEIHADLPFVYCQFTLWLIPSNGIA